MKMISKVKKTVEKYALLQKGDRVVVALSGGPDSTALLKVLSLLAGEMNLTLIAAHFNHRSRGRDSEADENFCRNLAGEMGLAFCPGRLDRKIEKKGMSPEDFFRRQRYVFLNRVARRYKAQKIALGHHLNDQAETVLLHFLRGSGLSGLKGIAPQRDGRIIRPFIDVSRDEIMSFLKASKIDYRVDQSNRDTRYLRNKIRAGLIPYLKRRYNPRIEGNLAQMADLLREEDEWIKSQVEEYLPEALIRKNSDNLSLNAGYLKALPRAIRWRVIKTVLEELKPEQNGISYRHVSAVDDLIMKNESGRKVVLPMKIEARRDYDRVILGKRKGGATRGDYEYEMPVPGSVDVREVNVTFKAKIIKKNKIDLGRKNMIYLDLDKIKMPVIIRNRRDGDWFNPMGMRGRKKIKKHLIDCKISREKRDKIILLADAVSVISVGGSHLDDRVKITPESKNILAVEKIKS